LTRWSGSPNPLEMKVAVLGGGGFRTPLVWESVAEVAGDAGVDELVLHDVSAARLARIAAVVEGRRRERGHGPPADTTTDLVTAIDGAAVIFCALRVGGLEGRVVDEVVPLREGVLGQETVGPGGICFALRTVPVMLEIAEVVRRRAPEAWFLNFTNPAGLVTEAVRSVLGDRAVGICDSPDALSARVAAVLGRPMRRLEFDYAGLNHLGWLLAVREDGCDLLPGLLADDRLVSRVDEGRLFGPERLRELGMVPNEYLVYYERPGDIVNAFRRAGATRAQVLLGQQGLFYEARDEDPAGALASWRRARDARHQSYMAEAWEAATDAVAEPVEPNGGHGSRAEVGGAPVDEGPGEAGYAAIAAAFLRAIARDNGESITLNVGNRGRLPFLDDEAVVEVPCSVSAAGPRPRAVGDLGGPQADLVQRVKEVERTTIRAAREGSRLLALEAMAAHPVVPTRAAADRILRGYLGALPELAGRLR
jgi:6-phospho-beta-glucosidase